MRNWIWIVAVPAWVGCSDYNIKNDPDGAGGPAPDIVVDPGSLVYSELRSGEEEVQTFTVRNVGESTLNVSDIVIGSGLAFTVLGPEIEFDLEPEEETTVDVAFSPMGADDNYGQVLVLSDDPDTPEAPVDLLGYGAVPELQITPDSYVFGESLIPCGGEVELTLTNVGSEDLIISDWDYRSAGFLTLDDSMLRPELPITLAPNESRAMTVYFSPTDAGADTGILSVTSNDPRGVVEADQNGEGSFGDEETETFTQPGVVPVDVMMLIDHSGSMEGANTNDVETGIPAFVQELRQVADWQMIQVTREDGCANGGIMTPTTPNPEQLLIDHAWDAGGGGVLGGYLTEALLELASDALDQTGPGQCNQGFLRPGALLHIITISDEPEQSGNSYVHWLGQYSNHVAGPEFVRVSAVVDVNNTCGDLGTGYIDAANATGGSLLNICNSNWGTQFGDIASEILDGIRTYNLSDPAIPGTIVVTVNGVPTTDFTYSAAGNSVTVNNPPIGDGDVVEVTYNVAGEC
ncbi:MAG: choice-of-anchor D domain-containing protein [Myxococcota bacterium]